MAEVVAIDCEMVEVISDNKRTSAAARVTVVNENGRILIDKYIKPSKNVSDFRTFVSGVTKENLDSATESLDEVRKQVAKLIHGKILVGHSLDKDLKALELAHPEARTCDLALYPPFKMTNGQTTSLKQLAQRELGREIQTGPHSSAEDAKASMDIYKVHASKLNQWMLRK